MRRRTTEIRGWTTSRRGRFGIRFVVLLFALSTVGGLFTTATPRTASADELDDAYSRQQQLQKLISKQKASINSLAANQAALSRRIADTKTSLDAINANLILVKSQIVSMVVDVARSQSAVDELVATAGRLDAELLQIEAEAASKERDLADAKAVLASRIVDAYDTDRRSMIETFLSSDDFTDVITEVGYQLDFAEQDKILAEQIVTDQRILDVLHQNVELARAQTAELHELAATAKAALDLQMESLRETREMLAKLEAETERLLKAQQSAYRKLAADKAKMRQQLAAAKEAQRKLEALIARLVREQLAKGGIPSVYNGTFMWPMPGRITQEFGCTGFAWEPPQGNCAHFHKGLDIANDMYTPIRAAGDGKVLWAGLSPYDPSWIVIIAHSADLVTWYAHIDNKRFPPAVRAGQFVAKGDVIAYEGNTGWSTGPHLEWSVNLSGNWVNPRLFLPR